MRNFYGCYLLRSLDPAARVKTYIGFTVNPRRRIRQHNGEISSGAWRTRRGRPWEMVLVVYGFPTQVHALQFEWAWQHPKKSKVAREVLADIKISHRTGLQGKVRLLLGMLHAPPWRYYPLTLQFLSEEHSTLPRGCPDLPPNLDVLVGPLDTLPSCVHDDLEEGEDGAAAAAAGSESDSDAAGGASGADSTDASDGDTGSSSEADTLLHAKGVGTVQYTQQQRQQHAEASQGSDSSSRRRHRHRPLTSSSSGSSEVEVLSDQADCELLQPLAARLRAAAAGHEPVAVAAAAVDSKPAATAAAAGGSKRKPKGRSSAPDAAASEAAVCSKGCGCCHQALHAFVLSCTSCSAEFHTQCLAEAFSEQQQQQQANPAAGQPPSFACDPSPSGIGSTVLQRRQLPPQGSCPCCGARLVWLDALAATKRFGGSDGSSGAQGGRKQRTRQRKTAAGKAAKGTAEASSKGSRRAGAPKARAAAAAASADTNTTAAAAAKKPRPGHRKGTAGRPGSGVHIAAAATASAAAEVSPAAVTALDQPSQQQRVEPPAGRSALSDLLEHLQQQYPGLHLPSDPAVLQQLLLRQETADLPASSDILVPSPQKQLQPEGPQCSQASPSAAAAAAADAMDLCSSGDEGQGGVSHQQQQVCGRGRRQMQTFTDWLDEHLQDPQQQHEVPLLLQQQQQQQHQDQQLMPPCDLTASPEPLLRRLNLKASPAKGKRSRATVQGDSCPPAAALAGDGTAAIVVNSSGSDDGFDNSGSSSGSVGRTVLRSRPNGSTPAAMVAKGRLSGAVQSELLEAAVAVEQGVSNAVQAQQVEAVCLLDSD